MFYLKGRLSVRTQRTCSLNLSPTIILIIPFTYSTLFHCISMWRTWAQRVLLGGNLLLFPSSNVLPCGTVVATPRFSAYFLLKLRDRDLFNSPRQKHLDVLIDFQSEFPQEMCSHCGEAIPVQGLSKQSLWLSWTSAHYQQWHLDSTEWSSRWLSVS